jgi:alkaline phosphatase D
VLWPAVIFFWLQFILSFILILYLDLETPEPIVNVETTDIVEVISNGAEKLAIIETETETRYVEPPKPTMMTTRPVSWMETIYLGIPNPNLLLSFFTTGINAVMLLLTLDLTFRRYFFYPATDLMFHRPIPTSPYTANILIRSPPDSPLPLRLFYKPVDYSIWETGPVVLDFDNTSDYTSVISLYGLSPNTPYAYAVLPPDIDINTANQSSFGTFETFPSPGKRGRWSFGSSSCIMPGIPYNPLGNPLRIQGLEFLEKDMADLKFFAFLGTLYALSFTN